MITSRTIENTNGDTIGFGIGMYATKSSSREILQVFCENVEENHQRCVGGGLSFSSETPVHIVFQVFSKMISIKLFSSN